MSSNNTNPCLISPLINKKFERYDSIRNFAPNAQEVWLCSVAHGLLNVLFMMS